jgi:hypothetical protein
MHARLCVRSVLHVTGIRLLRRSALWRSQAVEEWAWEEFARPADLQVYHRCGLCFGFGEKDREREGCV